MDERKELLQAIRRSRRKLNIAKLIDTCVFCLAYAGVAAIVLEAVSLWIPFYYVHLCVVIVIGIALIVGIIYAVIKRTSMREAAQQIDTFGLKERVQTAYEQMADESPLAGMQRHDAAEQLQKKLDAKQIRIRLLPSRRHLAAAFLSLAVAAALAFVPSQARELANTRHAIHQEAKEKQKELSELADAIEKMDTSELTDEQKARLAKLKEALDRSMQELARADSKEALDAAQSKLGFKYEQTSQSLMELADALSKDGKAALEQIAEKRTVNRLHKAIPSLEPRVRRTDLQAVHREPAMATPGIQATDPVKMGRIPETARMETVQMGMVQTGIIQMETIPEAVMDPVMVPELEMDRDPVTEMDPEADGEPVPEEAGMIMSVCRMRPETMII